MKASPTELQGRVTQVLDQVRALEKEVAQLKGKLASSQGDELVAQAVDVKGIKVLAARLDGADAKTLRDTMDKLKDKLKTAAIVLAAVDGGKVQIAAGVTADSMGRVKAGELVNFVAQQVGGKGGGKADMAMAGGTDASKLPLRCSRCRAGWRSGPRGLSLRARPASSGLSRHGSVAGRYRTILPSGVIVTRSMARTESRTPARRLMRKPPTS